MVLGLIYAGCNKLMNLFGNGNRQRLSHQRSHPEDIILIFLTVILVGWLSVWYPMRYMSRKLPEE